MRRLGIVVVAAGLGAALAACAIPPSGAGTEPVAFDQSAALRSVNAFRAENGLVALSIDPRLTRAAATQSAAMAVRDRMDHAVAGRLPGRVEATGYDWSVVAENIGRGYRDYPSAMAGWVASPGHRRNLLNPNVKNIGFGAARDTKGGRAFWTQVFAAPKAPRGEASLSGLRPASATPAG